MTEQQHTWASQHDWYVDWEINDNGGMVAIVIERFSGGGHIYHRFDDYQALRAWAGY
jgi:hypothetical protein